MVTVTLAATHHDADGRMLAQMARVLPLLNSVYCRVTVFQTPATVAESQALLRAHGATVAVGSPATPTGHLHLGIWRRQALALGLHHAAGASHIHFCDLDRVLHWAEFHMAELAATLAALPTADLTVLGRTPRAFASHPRVQRDTESLVNHVFQLSTGLPWDMMAASRGLSLAAAQHIVRESRDDTLGTDCSWPLLLWGQGSFTLSYREVEGLEFETLDRYDDEVAALGGAEAWLNRMDADPQQWAYRLHMAQVEVAAIVGGGI
ncbi:MAG: hypothetical protein MUD01_23335 [Chloroflexaceae bacterium]|nr:hypothetical protein [Chloroflexaceae bacterium]